MKLSPEGKRLLRYIVSRLGGVDPSEPRTFPTYSDAHAALGLHQIGKDIGQSLQRQGLDDLAEFAAANALPAVTGLIVRKNEHDPGKGFYTFYGRDEFEDCGWWLEEVRRSVNMDWSPYLNC